MNFYSNYAFPLIITISFMVLVPLSVNHLEVKKMEIIILLIVTYLFNIKSIFKILMFNTIGE